MQIDANDLQTIQKEMSTAYLSAISRSGQDSRTPSQAAVFQANHTFRLKGHSDAARQSPGTWSGEDRGGPIAISRLYSLWDPPPPAPPRPQASLL